MQALPALAWEQLSDVGADALEEGGPARHDGAEWREGQARVSF